MDTKYIKNIDKLYQGCINTPNLWCENVVHDLPQFQVSQQASVFNTSFNQKLRLGKLVERFIAHQLNQDDSTTLLAENVQIQQDKQTLGELDCILEQDGIPIHLEIIYKFYLYDTSVGNTPLDHWIGPNQNDSLVKKLDKLKNKQLPLLYNQHCKPLLKRLQLNPEKIQQKVCFKAQLFVPLNLGTQSLGLINHDCIQGIYIKRNALDQFADCKFYIPEKLEWLLETHPQVTWQTYDSILKPLNELLDHKMAPMVWIKNANGIIQKCFVVWW